MTQPDCQILHINHSETHSFSKLILDYLNNEPMLTPFYQFELNEHGLQKAIQSRQQFPVNRELLVRVLKSQYDHRIASQRVMDNLDALLLENTFTICSAHQPNLMTGHLYFFYKIIHSIVLAQQCNDQYPDHHFVPVFYIGSEDNDFEELNHFFFRGKNYQWSTQQTGAVGRMRGIDLEVLKTELYKNIGEHEFLNREIITLIDECYSPQNTIAEATAHFLNRLLGDYGLVVIDADDAALKAQVKGIFKDEILHQSSYKIVSETSHKLKQHYNSQAFIRELNLFYLKENIRERIIAHDHHYSVNNTDINFSQDEILEELDLHPERFSPNVILRGVYQESILPNIAFIGGGSEVAYWFQLKDLFQHHQVFYPMVILRQSLQIIHQNTLSNIQKNNLSWGQVFAQKEIVLKELIHSQQDNLDLSDEEKQLKALIDSVTQKVQNIDPNLVYTSGVIQKGILDLWERLQKKMYKAEKKKWQIKESQFQNIHNHIFPLNVLQERQENVLEYYVEYGPAFFDMIIRAIQPFGQNFGIIILPENGS